MRRFPFRRFFKDSLVVGVIALACALIITIISEDSGGLGINLVFSLTIAAIAFVLIDGPRLLFWSTPERPPKLMFFVIVLAAVPVAQFGGTMLATYLTGNEVPPLGKLVMGRGNRMLLFTLIFTAGAIFIQHHRDRLIRAEAQAAHEKARAELVARQAMQAQLQLLQAQVEPHMLFNTLANLQGMIGIDPERAQQMLDQLIQYLRATLSSSRAEVTTLGREFSLMEAYLGLMSVRMGARLTFTLDLPGALRSAAMPPMLLQPLVENAIIHGLEPKVEGGHVSVTAEQLGEQLLIKVTDTGLGLGLGLGLGGAAAKAGTALGVTNTRARLHALFGERGILSLEPNPAGGAVARLALPLEQP